MCKGWGAGEKDLRHTEESENHWDVQSGVDVECQRICVLDISQQLWLDLRLSL